MSAPTITIRHHGGDELPFRVTLDPSSADQNTEGRFACHKAAYGYAVGLRMTHGGTVIDVSGDKDCDPIALKGAGK